VEKFPYEGHVQKYTFFGKIPYEGHVQKRNFSGKIPYEGHVQNLPSVSFFVGADFFFINFFP